MSPESRAYYESLGSRLARLREAKGYTQAEVARSVGASQQAVYAWEIGGRRISVFVLTKLAKVYSVTVEQLIGLPRPLRVPKRRLSPRAMRHAERLQALSKTQRRFVVRIIDALEERNVSVKRV